MKSIDPCAGFVDPVHRAVNLVYVFSSRKIIQKIPEIPTFGDFAQKALDFILFMF
jgi:hypothetical protein